MSEKLTDYNVFDPNCNARRTLDLIADKWTALVITVLMDGTARYNQIRRRIGGISDKMLAQTLQKLEREGLITRVVYPVVPPHVDYSLTPLGETLSEPLTALIRWSETHGRELGGARQRPPASAPDVPPAT
jgi:DNA-binding HxlR family transcriptional regulator